MAVQTAPAPYQTKEFPNIKGLKGLSDEQMEQHYKLYQGYVTNVNKLGDELRKVREKGELDTPEYAEMKRRQGWEWDGMILHEYFFENLKANGGELPAGSLLASKLEEAFGSLDAWKQEFMTVCKMRGVGWAMLYQDPRTGKLNTFWASLHEDGHPAGYRPILAIDIWEHAWTVDYKPTERAKYLEAVFQNIDWKVVESRLQR